MVKLELVRDDDDVYLSEEERERKRRRMRAIPPEELRVFQPDEVKEIKAFLTEYITLSEQLHYDFECAKEGETFSETELEHLQGLRNRLFDRPALAVAQFIWLLDLFPNEPWQEIELMLASLRGEDARHYFEHNLNVPLGGVMLRIAKVRKEQEQERKRLELKCRITPSEIARLVYEHSLEEIVRHVIMSRRVASGHFWGSGAYDL